MSYGVVRGSYRFVSIGIDLLFTNGYKKPE